MFFYQQNPYLSDMKFVRHDQTVNNLIYFVYICSINFICLFWVLWIIYRLWTYEWLHMTYDWLHCNMCFIPTTLYHLLFKPIFYWCAVSLSILSEDHEIWQPLLIGAWCKARISGNAFDINLRLIHIFFFHAFRKHWNL